MIGLVIATHGQFGAALLAAAQLIIGEQSHAVVIGLSRDDNPDSLRGRFSRAIAEAGTDCDAVLLLTDMFGGTPTNIGMTFLAPNRVEVLAGVNLPMLLKFFSYRERHALPELATLLQSYSRDGIVIASEMLQRQE